MTSRSATAHIQDSEGGRAVVRRAGAGTDYSPRSAGLRVRRWLLVASPVLAGLFAILGAAADPAVGQDGVVLWQAYTENPESLQFKSFGFHWAYSFWMLPSLL
nr:hypothetical protein [Nocardioidaceae bacterium]